MLKNKSFFRLVLLSLFLSIFMSGCMNLDRQQADELREDLDLSVENLLDMDRSDLERIKKKGIVDLNQDGELESITYRETVFGLDDVESIYHFEDGEKVSGIQVNFPENTDMDQVVKFISDEIGEPQLAEVNDEYNDRYFEWLSDGRIYYSLNNFKKADDGDLLELTIIIMEK